MRHTHPISDYLESNFADIILDETEDRGVDVIFDNVGEAVMTDSMKCIAYDGRYLMMGFASDKSVVDEKLLVPRAIAAGNFKICGATLVYASEGVRRMLKRGPGWNFISEQMGLRIMRETNELVLAARIKPVIGRVANFDELPAAIEDLAGRKTIGRTIVRLW